MPIIRASTDADMPAITAIYSHHVLTGTGTFEIDPPTLAEMTARRADVLGKGLPYLVVAEGADVLGTEPRERHGEIEAQSNIAVAVILAAVARRTEMPVDGIILAAPAIWGWQTQPAINRWIFDLAMQVMPRITVQPKAGREVVRQISRMPEVRQLCAVSGEFDYVVLLRAESALRMNTLLDEMGNFDGVVKTTTSVALEWKIDRT